MKSVVIPRNLNAEQSVQRIQRSFVNVHNYILKNRGWVQSVLPFNGGSYENLITLFCLEKTNDICLSTWHQARLPAEFKHINKRRKRKQLKSVVCTVTYGFPPSPSYGLTSFLSPCVRFFSLCRFLSPCVRFLSPCVSLLVSLCVNCVQSPACILCFFFITKNF